MDEQHRATIVMPQEINVLSKFERSDKTRLARYRILGPKTSIYVSPFGLGAMNIGDKYGSTMGELSKENSFKLLDAYAAAGGNYIDTANGYQAGESEKFVGEWAEARGIRDDLVIATRYSGPASGITHIKNPINMIGNGRKSMHLSVEQSLKSLRTSYIDILYVHWWDGITDLEEIVDSLHPLVTSGKVLYLGISDTPAWMVVRMNMYARQTGKTPFTIYQGLWSIMDRDLEREIVPMCIAEGMAICPFGVLGRGKFMTDEQEADREKTGDKGREFWRSNWKRNEKEREISLVLEKIAKEIGHDGDLTAVALAWIMQKTPYVIPVLGGRHISQLEGNIRGLDVALTPEQIKMLETTSPLKRGFPHDLALRYNDDGTIGHHLIDMAGTVDRVLPLKAIVPK